MSVFIDTSVFVAFHNTKDANPIYREAVNKGMALSIRKVEKGSGL